MCTKIFIGLLTVLGITISIRDDAFVGAALRRVPKVYNALITTDENLTPSRAFPVIQPTIQETGIAHFPLSPFHPYSFASPIVRLVPPGLPAPQPVAQFYSQVMPRPYAGAVQPPPTAPAEMMPKETQTPPTAPEKEDKPATQESPMPPPTAPMQTKKANAETAKALYMPVPLNQYGLPPSLIPLRQYPPPIPAQLPPYPFRPYPPVVYSPFAGFRPPFLPPYDYLPNGLHFPLSNAIPGVEMPPIPTPPPQTTTTAEMKPTQMPPKKRTAPPQASTTTPASTPSEVTADDSKPTEPTEPTVEPTTQPSFEHIKNGSKSEDSNVPDVPPPPLPMKAKS